MKIWERYLLLRLFSTAAFILSCIFGVFVLVDLSIHSVRFFADGKTHIFSVLLYYLQSFSMHLELFFSLAFLLSTLKVLFDLTHHFELVALQMAGLSNRLLTRPLFILAASMTLLSYANSEWLSPDAGDSIESFRADHAKHKKQAKREHVHSVIFDDGSEIVYQRFDLRKRILFDAFWVRSPDELWHIKTLELNQTPLVGHFVDRIVRVDGQLAVQESFETCPLPSMPLDPSQALQKFIPCESRPLLTLFSQSFKNSADLATIKAHLHYKLSLPLVPIFLAFALPPILLRFSRQKATFLIAAGSLFALIAIFTIFDGLLILAENRVLSPAAAFWTPSLLGFCAALRQFLKFS